MCGDLPGGADPGRLKGEARPSPGLQHRGGQLIHAMMKCTPDLDLLLDISLRSCGFGGKSESALMEALGSCVQMEDISLSENTFTEQCFLKLANQFPRLRLLKKLDLRVCGVSDNVCKSLAEDLGCCQNLEEIILSWNRIGDDGTCALSSSLKHMRRLKKLDLEKNQIRVKGAEALAHALSFCLWIKVIR
ncbi:hypothetical protein GDO81_015951 [Engystomops pustulosus]|uniref:Uncharacterized protein n=1 Tax=Engystomops pustulosus TaxID=76066 RepID=A0AAV7AUB2_ENGPU|nr:hypothetical protein GDO81_015951 [Engystomops pustulosus]